MSSFYKNFGGEDVVVRPGTSDREPFLIEVLITDAETVFPPSAPAREGDTVERQDPRGGVIESVITEYRFRKDPFGNGNDHWAATLVEKGHAARRFGQQNIVVNVDGNQFSFGNDNTLHQTTNYGVSGNELVDALNQLAHTMPRDEMTAEQAADIVEMLDDAREKAANDGDPRALRRALLALRGALAGVTEAATEGVKDSVRTWMAGATTLLVQYLAGGGTS